MAPLTRYIENPLPHIQDAKEAAKNIIHLKQELMTARAENVAIFQAKRAAWGVGCGISASLAILFATAWLGFALYRHGFSPSVIALIFFCFFGMVAALLARHAIKGGAHE